MTTILAAAAVVLFAILIAVCVFGYLHLSALLKDDEQKDEVKTQPGKYRNIADFDITSMHPSSCISEEPFSYRYSSPYKSYKQEDISFKVSMLKFKVDDLENDLDDVKEQTFCLDPDCNSLLYRVEKLEKLMLNDRVNDINRRIDNIYDNIEDPEDATFLFERVKKLEKLVQQLYTDRDEDVNKIADQINRHEDMISDLKEDGE